MRARRLIGLALVAASIGGWSPIVHAGEAREYRNCRALHRDWEFGVAKSRRAANAEVEDGYGYPKVSRRLYRANRDLDANDDGVACEA